jgi:hypothetical protein
VSLTSERRMDYARTDIAIGSACSIPADLRALVRRAADGTCAGTRVDSAVSFSSLEVSSELRLVIRRAVDRALLDAGFLLWAPDARTG